MLRLELEPITSSYFLSPFSKHLFSLVHGTKIERFKNYTFEKTIDLRPFSKVSIFIDVFGRFSMNDRRKHVKSNTMRIQTKT